MNVFRLSALAIIPAAMWPATLYFQTNLTSDIPGLAANTDPNLKNPWGMSFGATSPFWISDQVTNRATLYNGSGQPQTLVVTTPPGPTGTVFNGTSSFQLDGSHPAVFLFASLSGTISGWNPAVSPTSSVVKFTAIDHAAYTGLASGPSNLYAADFANAKIDSFDASFNKVTLAGTFTDPNLPAGYSPYNIQNAGGKLYVEYAKVDPVTHRASEASNQGIVDVFDTTGNFQQRLATESHLSSPWGITLAPGNFGQFSNDLLVGNFGDGTISAFDPATGAFLGQLLDASAHPITNDALWALNFRAPNSGFDSNKLFFNAGINGEADGLFGSIQPVPEPSPVILLGLGCVGLAIVPRRRTAR
ncbi:MAG: TIGR03118 family protein [Bryobacteraceae bacterium]